MKKILKFLRPHWVAALLAPLFMVVEVGMDLLQPILMASIIDNGVMENNQTHILHMGLYMIGVAIIGLISGIGCSIFAAKASMRFGEDLRSETFAKVQSFSFRNMDKMDTGSVVTRLTNDIVQLQNMVQMLLRVLVRSPLLLIGSLIMAIYISLKLSVVIAVAVPLLFIVMFLIIKSTLPLFSIVQARLDRMNTVLQESLKGIRLSKAFVRHTYEEQRFGTANHSFTDTSIKAQTLIALNAPILMFILNLSIIAVLLIGGKDVIEETFEVGLLVAYINYVTQLLHAISNVANNLVKLSSAKVSADRVAELLDEHSEIIDNGTRKDKIEGSIEFRNVNFQYQLNQPTLQLQNINFFINKGKKLAILGATGAGKTTLVSLIPRLYDCTEGEVLIDGTPIKHYSLTYLRSQISYVLQESILFTGTIAQNTAYAKPEASIEEIKLAAYIACADEFIERLPQQYETELGQRGINLSGGQKQRISIARAILKQSPIIILDDSTSAIDMRTESLIQHRLKQYLSQSTIIIVAQKISSIVDADEIILLDEGKIVASGTHDQLLKSSSLYQEIYTSQLGNEEVAAHV